MSEDGNGGATHTEMLLAQRECNRTSGKEREKYWAFESRKKIPSNTVNDAGQLDFTFIFTVKTLHAPLNRCVGVTSIGRPRIRHLEWKIFGKYDHFCKFDFRERWKFSSVIEMRIF